MISRVVPLATGHPLELVAEDYNEWVADKNNFKGEDPGWPFFELTERLEARLERKLWIHNGGHATVAYAAFMRGHTYIHEAVADPEIADFTVKVMRELGDAVIHKHGFDTEEIRAYEDDFGPRGAIVEMMDEVARVVRNPLRKLAKADRLTAPAIYAETHGLSNRYILRSIVNVTLYDAPDDEKAVEMQEYIKKSGFEAFLNEVIGIKEYPEMVKKLVDMRKELVCQSR